MRNIIEHPLTAEEVKHVVQRAAEDEYAKRQIGSLDGLVWHGILLALDDSEVMERVLKEVSFEQTSQTR